MTNQEISNIVEEKVFHQCRHIWIPDLHFVRRGFNSTRKCLSCKRSSLTVETAGLPTVGNGAQPYASNVEIAIKALQKMERMYSCITTIRILAEYIICSITSKALLEDETPRLQTIATESTLPLAISKAMIKYVAGDDYID